MTISGGASGSRSWFMSVRGLVLKQPNISPGFLDSFKCGWLIFVEKTTPFNEGGWNVQLWPWRRLRFLRFSTSSGIFYIIHTIHTSASQFLCGRHSTLVTISRSTVWWRSFEFDLVWAALYLFRFSSKINQGRTLRRRQTTIEKLNMKPENHGLQA